MRAITLCAYRCSRRFKALNRLYLFILFTLLLQPFLGLAACYGGESDVGLVARLHVCENNISLCVEQKIVRLHGANIFTPYFIESKWKWANIQDLRGELSLLKASGGNFVIIGYDPSRSDDPNYVDKIVQSLEVAKSLGLFVQLTQHHMRLDPSVESANQKLTVEVPIEDRGATFETNISDSWRRFLSHSGIRKRLANVVDIFGMLSEPGMYVAHAGSELGAATRLLKWYEWKPRAEKICDEIRSSVRNDVICSISGTNFAWNFDGLLGNPFRLPNIVAEVHEYKWHDDRGQTWERDIQPLVGKVPILVGEFGAKDPVEYVESRLKIFDENRLSWAAWPGPARSWVENYKLYSSPLTHVLLRAMGTRSSAGN